MSTLPAGQHVKTICQQHRIWPISYKSRRWPTPLHLIWYTDQDENSTDRLLTNQAGDIVAAGSLTNLINAVQKQTTLAQLESFTTWLAALAEVRLSAQACYDTAALVTSLTSNRLDRPTLEDLTNWRNLFADFACQDSQNNYLQSHYQDPLLHQVWTYYYECVFWPNFYARGQAAERPLPPLPIDSAVLLGKVVAMIAAFDARIQLVDSVHIAG